MNRAGTAVACCLVLAACGSQTADPSRSGSAASSPSSDTLFTETTVLEGQGHGPQLCLGGVMESYPPQCGGPDLVGWDWQEIGGFERANGTTWGQYVVVGTYDRDRDTFTLTEPAVAAEQYDGPRPSSREPQPAGTPCEEPAGGWQVREPELTTEAALRRVQRTAAQLPGYAGFWYDQSINPASGSEDPAEVETLMNDPEKLVVNVSVTGDLAEAEAALRAVWGGALCVSQGQHTEAELRHIQGQLTEMDGMLGVGAGHDRVELTVVHDDGTLQQRLDEEYGVGVVVVTSALQPYPG